MAGALTGALFIAGAHTDIGKTHVACALLHAAIARGLTVDAFKPVVSGFDPDEPAGSDPARLLAALGKAATPEAVRPCPRGGSQPPSRPRWPRGWRAAASGSTS